MMVIEKRRMMRRKGWSGEIKLPEKTDAAVDIGAAPFCRRNI